MSLEYKGSPFYFCTSRNQYYRIKQCNNETIKVPPKKAVVYNKPKHQLTKRQQVSWAMRFKYR